MLLLLLLLLLPLLLMAEVVDVRLQRVGERRRRREPCPVIQSVCNGLPERDPRFCTSFFTHGSMSNDDDVTFVMN